MVNVVQLHDDLKSEAALARVLTSRTTVLLRVVGGRRKWHQFASFQFKTEIDSN